MGRRDVGSRDMGSRYRYRGSNTHYGRRRDRGRQGLKMHRLHAGPAVMSNTCTQPCFADWEDRQTIVQCLLGTFP